ncbi:MAG: serine hydrolase, partial [Clostridiales bacterium]|nr:serine hydrolase [Clostridiales bacterium]
MRILDTVAAFPGEVGFYAKRLTDGRTLSFGQDRPLVAASVIKIPVMVSAYRLCMQGGLDLDEEVVLRAQDKMPSCGALTYMHDGLTVTVQDLITLMIILSDNTATNLMIRRLGIERVNADMQALGIPGICLRRLLF